MDKKIRLYGRKFGQSVLYLFGRLDSAVCTSSVQFDERSLNIYLAILQFFNDLYYNFIGYQGSSIFI